MKVAFQGSHVTSDASLILVRELDERLGLETLIAEHLNDARQASVQPGRSHATVGLQPLVLAMRTSTMCSDWPQTQRFG
ncbi:MAG: transposase [Acidobacteria bacterium]|nr:transposase [Acidobacteriota bacterium]